MADLKISQLPFAATPLTGAEVVPIDQAGNTVQVALNNISLALTSTYLRSQVNPNVSRFGSGIPISSRCMWTGPNGVTTANWSASNSSATFRQKHPLIMDACNLRLVYLGYGQSGQSGHDDEENPNNILGAESFTVLTINAGIECKVPGTGGNITYPVTFLGNPTGTLYPGGILVSDPLGVHLQKSVQNYFYVRSYVSSGNQYPLGVSPLGLDSEGTDTGGNKTGYNNATGSFVAGAPLFGPWMVLGETQIRNQPVIGCLGDSIITGTKNNIQDGVTITTTTNDRSFLDVALNNTVPLVKLSRSSGTALIFSSTRLTQGRHSALGICTHVFVHYGRNDLNNGSSAATVYAELQTISQFLRLLNCKVYLCTILPETTSTDNWVTVVNQTQKSWEANRLALNALIRGSVVDGTADVAVDLCASGYEVNASGGAAVNGGFIAVNGVTRHFTSDGIHPAYDGNLLIGNSGVIPTSFSI